MRNLYRSFVFGLVSILTVSALAAKTLAFAVATVTGRAHTFLVSEKLKIQLQHDDVPPIIVIIRFVDTGDIALRYR